MKDLGYKPHKVTEWWINYAFRQRFENDQVITYTVYSDFIADFCFVYLIYFLLLIF